MDAQFEDLEGPRWLRSLERIFLSVLAVAALTGLMLLIGRDWLGEGVIALLYLIPVSWSAARWGLGAGIAAAIAAGLSFNFFFIPPFYTLYIGSLEGWLLLAIFLVVATVVVGRIQVGLNQAKAREREAIFMYELSAALSNAFSPQSVARVLAENTQQLYQAALVRVSIEMNGDLFLVSVPEQAKVEGKAGLVLPLLAGGRFAGELCLWPGTTPLPPANDRLLLNFTNQGGLALERARLVKERASKNQSRSISPPEPVTNS